MFDKLRRPVKAKSVFSYLILGLIVLVFIFIGFDPRNLGVQQKGAVALVNNTYISFSEYQEALQRMREQDNSLGSPKSKEEQKKLREQVVNELIHLELLNQKAKKERVMISNAEVRDTISQIPVFRERGIFRRERYNRYLEYTRNTSFEFEDKIRKSLIYSKFLNAFMATLQKTSIETKKEDLVNQVRFELDFVFFELSKIEDLKLEEVKEVEDNVKFSRNEKVEEFIKKRKLEWTSTGIFGLEQKEFPKILGSTEAFKRFLQSKLKEGKLFPEVVSVFGKSYILKIKKIEKLDKKKNALGMAQNQYQHLIHTSIVRSIFSDWIEFSKKSFIVKKYI